MSGRVTRGIALTLAVAVVASCAGGDGGGTVTVSRTARLSGDERRYGAGFAEHSAITYQPDVVILGGGPSSVRSVSSDGLVWTIDGGAKGADELRPGKVLLATNLAAGRVLAVDDVGGDKRVALGPVALTDVIEDGTIRSSRPVPLGTAYVYSTPDAPGASGAEGSTPAAGPGRAIRPGEATGTGVAGGWRFTSICCTSNGIHISWDGGGARAQATAQITFDQPRVGFSLSIGGGSLINASAHLYGAASLRVGVSAAVESSASNVSSNQIQVPATISVPIPVAGIPLTINFQQVFEVRTGLTGRAALSTEGVYKLGGALGFSYVHGRASADVPTLSVEKSALDKINTLAVAPQGMTVAWGLKTTIGVGFAALSAGVWYKVVAALSFATSGAQIDPIQGTSLVSCKTLSLRLIGSFGVGYSIPKFVADAINLLLGAVMRHPPIRVAPTGGPELGKHTLFSSDTPPCSNSRFG